MTVQRHLRKYPSLESNPIHSVLIPSSRKLIFETKKHDRKPQAIKCKTVKPGPKVYTYNTVAAPKTQGSFWKKGQKVKRVCGEVVSPEKVRSYYKVSPIWLPKYVLNKDDSKLTWSGEACEALTLHQISGQLRNAEIRQMSSPGQSTPMSYSIASGQT